MFIITFLSLVIVFLIYLMPKIENAYRNHCIILNAIYDFLMAEYEHTKEIRKDKVYFTDMEEMDDTIFRLWDWSYKRILPPEKFKYIEAYIKPYEKRTF